MKKQALIVIDMQNDITKHYRDVIGSINEAIARAVEEEIPVVYIQHENCSAGTRNFKQGTRGFELVPELHVVSEQCFIKSKANALTSEAFMAYIEANRITDFIITGGDATGCVKSTAYNMTKSGYGVTVLSDCVTSYDLKKVDEMLRYYESKGCKVIPVSEAFA